MIAIGVQRPGKGQIDTTVDTSLYKGFLAVTNIVFAYGKGFTSIISVDAVRV